MWVNCFVIINQSIKKINRNTIMKKIILLITVILTLASCERQSGRRPVQEPSIYFLEYINEDEVKVTSRFTDHWSASKYRNHLDSLNLWSRLYSEPINSIK